MITFTAKVYGIAWAGYKASTKYVFYHKQPSRAEIKAKAGDFQNVTRIHLIKTTTTVERVKVGN